MVEEVDGVATVALAIAAVLLTQATSGYEGDDEAVVAAQAWFESNEQNGAVSCPFSQPDTSWASPNMASSRTPCFCGVWQTEAKSPSACRAMRDRSIAARTRRLEMRRWFAWCAVRNPSADQLRCALSGYGYGVAMALRGDSSYADEIVRGAQMIRDKEARDGTRETLSAPQASDEQ